jgi:hypothetical protein
VNRSKTTLAAALDRMRWDYSPDKDRRFLLDPIGKIFQNLPWEARAYNLGPVPVYLRFGDSETAVELPVLIDRPVESA